MIYTSLLDVAASRPSGDCIVLAHGCFDLLHPGHLRHLEEARAMGKALYVGLTSDRHIRKGPGRPVLTAVERAELLQGFRLVDHVVIVDDPTALPLIEALRPDVYVKGPDYSDGLGATFTQERAAVEGYGGKVFCTNGVKFSSTALLDRYCTKLVRSPEITEYLQRFRESWSADDVLGWLDKAKQVEADVIGESIVDEYIYVAPAGKSTKENLVTFVERPVVDKPRHFRGGADIVQAHLGEAIGRVLRLQSDSHELTLTKTRYIDPAFGQKLFSLAGSQYVKALKPGVLAQVPSPLTVVADFGHGLIDHEMAQRIGQWACCLALTVQANSLNYGFNLLTKYARADYIVADADEVRLAGGDARGDFRQLLVSLSERLGCPRIVCTRGHHGCVAYDGQKFTEVPALATSVVDRMGAGDAFLGWTAGLAWCQAPMEVISFVGSVAAAIKVGMVGNQVVTASRMRDEINLLLEG